MYVPKLIIHFPQITPCLGLLGPREGSSRVLEMHVLLEPSCCDQLSSFYFDCHNSLSLFLSAVIRS